MTGLPQKNKQLSVYSSARCAKSQSDKMEITKKSCKVRLINVCFLKIWKKLQKCAEKIVRVPPQEWQKKTNPRSRIQNQHFKNPTSTNLEQTPNQEIPTPKSQTSPVLLLLLCDMLTFQQVYLHLSAGLPL